MRSRALYALAAVLAGCATGSWYRPDTTEQQFLADKWACEREAAAAYPPAMVTSGGYATPSSTTCTSAGYGMVNCVTTPGVQVPGATGDVNIGARATAMRSCLRAKGYVYRTN